jgi:hypothetical protein
MERAHRSVPRRVAVTPPTCLGPRLAPRLRSRRAACGAWPEERTAPRDFADAEPRASHAQDPDAAAPCALCLACASDAAAATLRCAACSMRAASAQKGLKGTRPRQGARTGSIGWCLSCGPAISSYAALSPACQSVSEAREVQVVPHLQPRF